MESKIGNKDEQLWESRMTAEKIAAGFRFADVQWDQKTGHLVWLEGRSNRNVLVCQPREGGGRFDLTREVTPRAQVGYGGGDYTVSQGTVLFVRDRSLYRQPLDAVDPTVLLEFDRSIASPTLSPDGRWIAVVTSTNQKDTLAILRNEDQPAVFDLFEEDFCMQPCWHPDGKRIAWVSWKHPNMPWDFSSIHVAAISLESQAPHFEWECSLDDHVPGPAACSQPNFSPDGKYLSFVSDHSGWTNLQIYSLDERRIVASLNEPAEHAPPPWIQGMRSIAWSGDGLRLFVIRNQHGAHRLTEFTLETGSVREIQNANSDFSSFSQISLDRASERLGLIASSYHCPASIVSLDTEGELRLERQSLADPVPEHWCSPYEHLSWTTNQGQECHGLYSPPRNPRRRPETPPPVVIKIHGGPTSQYAAEYDPDTLFFTTRGFAVFSLNYRGSSGYGRDYRERLRETWGERDVDDVRSAFEFLRTTERGDARHMILAGGSAGGFTALLALARFPGTFRAAICRYGVADLLALTEETHKFEAHYLDSLVGPLPEYRARYIERSPMSQFERIVDPIAVFQGEDDPVVPKRQSEALVASLRQRGIPHVYRLYPAEKHGWRKKETIKDYYETVEQFLKELA